ncbi:MAG: carboxypeptidase regulatory-like domain-containing protein [Thermoguttaceae bacterium]|nr:carboxypeptidase regulatory-like domain-containing protein [Thermoguttaceae bacterium]
MKRTFLGCAFALAALASAVGCGQKLPDGMPKLNPTTIKVIQDGQPLADAMITLQSADGSSKWSSGGTTDATGVATIVTHGQYKGAPTGKYKVAVSKTVGEGTPPPPKPYDAESERVYNEYIASGATYTEFFVVDPQFRLVDTTPLELEVVDGKNDLEVNVGEAVHEEISQGGGVL